MSDKVKAIVEDERKKIVEQVVADMQGDGIDWVKPWITGAPMNAVSGKPYKGGNRLHLMYIARKMGYTDNRWATFKQAKDAGWRVRKGSKSAMVEHWSLKRAAFKDGKMVRFLKGTDKAQDGETEKDWISLDSYSRVFNLSCMDNVPESKFALTDDTDEDIVDALIDSSRCKIDEVASDEAFYTPTFDMISVPLRSQFGSITKFSRTLIHEMVHSTGNKAALDRDIKRSFGIEDYALEELVAELGTMFVEGNLGFTATEYDEAFYKNHVAYVQNWVQVLDGDPDALFKAARLADKAADYLTERYNNREVAAA